MPLKVDIQNEFLEELGIDLQSVSDDLFSISRVEDLKTLVSKLKLTSKPDSPAIEKNRNLLISVLGEAKNELNTLNYGQIPLGDFEDVQHELFGFQGGNQASPLWFCGLEYQSGTVDLIKQRIKETVGNKFWLSQEESEYDVKHERFNGAIQSVAKEFFHLANLSDNEIKTEKHLFTEDGAIFKLNLFGYPEIPSTVKGFKYDYVKKCIKCENGYEDNRFMKMRELLASQDSSKVIICCSRTWPSTFCYAFAGEKGKSYTWNEIEHLTEKGGRKTIGVKKYVDTYKITTGSVPHYLLVVPFLSRGMSSDHRNEIVKIAFEKFQELNSEN